MGRRPRKQHVQRPSPLQQVELTRPLSTIPSEKASMDDVDVGDATPLSASEHKYLDSEKAFLEETSPAGGLVRDPMFWKRFSTAVHMSEVDLGVHDEEKGSRSNTTDSGVSLGKDGNDWLGQQAKEKRKCRTICVSITLVVVLIIVTAAVVGYYFTKIKPIQGNEK